MWDKTEILFMQKRGLKEDSSGYFDPKPLMGKNNKIIKVKENHSLCTQKKQGFSPAFYII